MDHLTGARSASAGYNRNTFFPAAREEPLKGGADEEAGESDAWDVYADFNNAGPRYSSAFGMGQNQAAYVEVFVMIPFVIQSHFFLDIPKFLQIRL